MHPGSHRGRNTCCSHQILLAIRCRSHRIAAGLYAVFLKLQASYLSAEYLAGGVPPLLSFQHLAVAGSAELKRVQVLAAGEVALMVLLRCIAAELMAAVM